MDAKINTKRHASAHYVLNRRAAFVLGTTFLLLGTLIGTFVFIHVSPQRRLKYLRESAQDYQTHEKWPQAVIQLRNIIQIEPEDVQALYELGKVQLRLYEQAVVKDSASGSIQAAAALEAAVASFRRVTALRHDHVEAQRWLLEFDLRVGQWQDALVRLEALNAVDKRHPLATLAWELLPSPHAELVTQARQALSQSKPERAVELLQRFEQDATADLDVVETLALAHARTKQTARWQSVIEKAEKAVGPSARLDFVRAECLLVSGNLHEAEHYAQRALRAPHVEVPARYLLAEIHSQRAGQAEAALPHWELAISQYRQILARVPWDQTAANNLSWALGIDTQRIDEGLAVSGAALAGAQTPNSNLLDTHGWLLLQKGQTARSILFLERAAQAAPEDPIIREHLGVAYRRAGRTDDALTRKLETLGSSSATSDRKDLHEQWQRLQLYLPPNETGTAERRVAAN